MLLNVSINVKELHEQIRLRLVILVKQMPPKGSQLNLKLGLAYAIISHPLENLAYLDHISKVSIIIIKQNIVNKTLTISYMSITLQGLSHDKVTRLGPSQCVQYSRKGNREFEIRFGIQAFYPLLLIHSGRRACKQYTPDACFQKPYCVLEQIYKHNRERGCAAILRNLHVKKG